MDGPSVNPETRWQYVSPAEIADTSDDEVIAAAAGKYHYVTGIQLSNTDTSVATYVVLKSGASTVIWKGFLVPYIAATPGPGYIQAVFPVPLKCALGEALNVACLTSSAQVTACVQGFTAAQ